MGQNVSEQCRCQDYGFLALCAPGEPGAEDKTQIETSTGIAYPQTLSEQGIEPGLRGQGGDSGRHNATNGTHAARDVSPATGFGDLGHDDSLGFLAPPPVHYDDSDGFLPPPPAPTGGGSPPRARGGMSPPSSPPVGTQGGAAAGLVNKPSLDTILSDLEFAEQSVYSEIFIGFGGGGSGPNFVGLDNAKCRDFIVDNSHVTLNDVDSVTLKAAENTMDDGLGLESFIEIMRNHAIDDADPLQAFFSMSSDGQHIGATECRDFLLTQAQQKLHVNYSEDRFDQIFTMVMMQAGVQITMEELVAYTGRMTRMVRIIGLCGH